MIFLGCGQVVTGNVNLESNIVYSDIIHIHYKTGRGMIWLHDFGRAGDTLTSHSGVIHAALFETLVQYKT